MLTLLVSPFVGIATEVADGCRLLDEKVDDWFAKRGHGPNFTRLVKLFPVAAALSVVVGIVS
jgi:hypothetical protein